MKVKRVCSLQNCEAVYYSNGFCKNHHTKWYKKLIDVDGNYIGGYKPLPSECRFPKCIKNRKSHLRNGLCNRHRKWAEKGIIDRDTCKILMPERIPGNKKAIPKLRKCIACGVLTAKRVRNFCPHHYGQYFHGIIDVEGVQKRPLKKVHKYKDDDTCFAISCNSKPQIRGWCTSCYGRKATGKIDAYGKTLVPKLIVNKGRKCSKVDCTSKAHAKGLCVLHYERTRFDYIGPENRLNVGQICSDPDCQKGAKARGMCQMHYYRFRQVEKDRVYTRMKNEGMPCVADGCGKDSYCRRLCITHYGRLRRGVIRQRREIQESERGH